MREIYAKLMKNCYTGMAYNYLRGKFPRLSDAKVKEGIFIGPQIRELFRDHQFDDILHGDEKAAWESFECVCSQLLRKNRAPNYKELVVSCYHAMKNLAVTCL
jgi:hypothetical protein